MHCSSYSIKILCSVQGNTEDHSKDMIKINEVRNTKGVRDLRDLISFYFATQSQSVDTGHEVNIKGEI